MEAQTSDSLQGPTMEISPKDMIIGLMSLGITMTAPSAKMDFQIKNTSL